MAQKTPDARRARSRSPAECTVHMQPHVTDGAPFRKPRGRTGYERRHGRVRLPGAEKGAHATDCEGVARALPQRQKQRNVCVAHARRPARLPEHSRPRTLWSADRSSDGVAVLRQGRAGAERRGCGGGGGSGGRTSPPPAMYDHSNTPTPPCPSPPPGTTISPTPRGGRHHTTVT